MTIKEMFKKVEAYNEIAKIVGAHEMMIVFEDDIYTHERFETYKEFVKFAKETYIAPAYNAILLGEYEFEEKTNISTWEHEFLVELYLCSK